MVSPLDELKPFQARITALLCDHGFSVNPWEGTEGTLRDTCIFSRENIGPSETMRKYYHMFLSLWDVSPISGIHESFKFGLHELDTAKTLVPNTRYERTNEDAILEDIRNAFQI